ncbi:MAG: glycosyltransferase, partial [Endomicrobiaceae bacterium]|nr:glycosyltransferase [Endomicrobiaceae bacterium]
GYKLIENEISNNTKITYLKNDKNYGVNYSRNRALDKISENDKEWVIFLDDDDILEKDALKNLSEIIDESKQNWIITNRADYNGSPFTKINKSKSYYSYIFDYLITKKIKGDATHCINTEVLKNIYFPKYVKQGEEWLFYYQLSLRIGKFYYVNCNTTLSDGYNPNGLNFRKRSKREKFSSLISLIKESWERKIIFHPTIIFYFLARFLMLIIK